MPALHIRDVSPQTVAALKQRAVQRGHSMQQELRDVLDAAAAQPLQARRRTLDLHTVSTGRTEAFDRADIYDDER